MWRVRTPLDCIQIDQLKQTVSFLQKNYEVRSVKFTKVIAMFFFSILLYKKDEFHICRIFSYCDIHHCTCNLRFNEFIFISNVFFMLFVIFATSHVIPDARHCQYSWRYYFKLTELIIIRIIQRREQLRASRKILLPAW